MDALKDACRASGDYSITLIPYYAQVIADDRYRRHSAAASGLNHCKNCTASFTFTKKEGMMLSCSVHWPREKRNSL